MLAVRTPRSRVSAGLTVLVAGLVAAIVVVGFWRPWATPAATVAAGAGDGAVPLTPAALELPENPTVLIFGDSWTYGSAAAAPTLGYAYVVAQLAGWTTIVDGVRGSGYLKPGHRRSGLRHPHRGARPGAGPRPRHRAGLDQRPEAPRRRLPRRGGCGVG
ncbi:hypothetical protein [Microbacterium aurum]